MSRRRFSFDQCGPALLVVGALAVSVWVFTLSKSSDRHPSGALDTTVAHIHALGVNPADDSLFAATHSGLFRFDDQGVATRVSDNHQDTLGFTVVGPDHFLASGHPDMSGRLAGQPALLGLVESTDAGQSWANVSLSGEADFHGLSVVNGTVYGWDSTSRAFMVSAESVRSWWVSLLPRMARCVELMLGDPSGRARAAGPGPKLEGSTESRTQCSRPATGCGLQPRSTI